MKYNWDKMNDTQKASAIRKEMELDTHNGTTKDDLLNMLRWLVEDTGEVAQ
jgi:NTP pyrophosphatase (non-canonical NTP hydrolase)